MAVFTYIHKLSDFFAFLTEKGFSTTNNGTQCNIARVHKKANYIATLLTYVATIFLPFPCSYVYSYLY